MKNLRPTRPSPAMVVALASLCVALGGSAIAATKLAPKNSVNSASVINNSLRLKDFKKSERTKLRGAKGDKGDTGPAGTPDGYTKTEADARYLGKSDASAFTQGAGSQTSLFKVLADSNEKATLTLPGIGGFTFACDATMSYAFGPPADGGDHVLWEISDNGGALDGNDNAPGTSAVTPLSSGNHLLVAQFHRSAGTAGENNATLVVTIVRAASTCRVHIQLTDSQVAS
jgi:hypothetical protein